MPENHTHDAKGRVVYPGDLDAAEDQPQIEESLGSGAGGDEGGGSGTSLTESWIWMQLVGGSDVTLGNPAVLAWDSANVVGSDFELDEDTHTVRFLTRGLYQVWLCPQIQVTDDCDGVAQFFIDMDLANSGVGIWGYELLSVDLRPHTDPRSGSVSPTQFRPTNGGLYGGALPWIPTWADPDDTFVVRAAGQYNDGEATLLGARSSLNVVRLA